jgi:hypothetical protein
MTRSIIFLIAVLYAVPTSAQQESARSLYGMLDIWLSAGTQDETEWNQELKKDGFTKKPASSVWSVTRPDGEVRLLGSLKQLPDATVVFFPSTAEQVAPALLTWFIEQSRYVRVEDGDRIINGLPVIKLGKGRSKWTEVTVTPNGRLIRSAMTFDAETP